MENSLVITLESIKDGFCKVCIKPVIGRSYYREFTREGLKEYLEQAKNYCSWKKYNFVFHDELGIL